VRPGGQGATKSEPTAFPCAAQGGRRPGPAPPVAAKAPHDLVQRLGECLSGKFQARAWKRTRLADAVQEVESFLEP